VKNRAALIAVATLVAGMLTACGGGGDTDAYCDSVKEAKTELGGLEDGDFAELDKAIDRIHELADDAPDEVADDWKVLDGAVSDMEAALEEAGLEMSDLEGLTQGEIPEGVDQQKLAALGADLNKIGSAEVQEAADNIEKHAKDECDVDLSGS
jgi:hypothetical protein